STGGGRGGERGRNTGQELGAQRGGTKGRAAGGGLGGEEACPAAAGGGKVRGEEARDESQMLRQCLQYFRGRDPWYDQRQDAGLRNILTPHPSPLPVEGRGRTVCRLS